MDMAICNDCAHIRHCSEEHMDGLCAWVECHATAKHHERTDPIFGRTIYSTSGVAKCWDRNENGRCPLFEQSSRMKNELGWTMPEIAAGLLIVGTFMGILVLFAGH